MADLKKNCFSPLYFFFEVMTFTITAMGVFFFFQFPVDHIEIQISYVQSIDCLQTLVFYTAFVIQAEKS